MHGESIREKKGNATIKEQIKQWYGKNNVYAMYSTYIWHGEYNILEIILKKICSLGNARWEMGLGLNYPAGILKLRLIICLSKLTFG